MRGHGGVDGLEELQELDGTMALVKGADDLTGLEVRVDRPPFRGHVLC